jgi:O-antigen ligase
MVATETYRDTTRTVDRFFYARGQQQLSYGLIGLLLFAVLNIWTRDRWPISISQVGLCALGSMAMIRMVLLGVSWTPPLEGVLFLGCAGIGLLQLAFNRTVSRFETLSAVADWFTLALAFTIGYSAFQSKGVCRRFRSVAIWFGGVLAVEAILQLFSSDGKIFWLIPAEVPEVVMGPFLNRDHYSTLMVLLLPIALWAAVANRKHAWLYGCLAAAMYASVIACASRAGTFLVTIEILIILFPAAITMPRESRLAALRTVLAIFLIIAVFSTVVGWETVLKRFEQGDPGRLEMWRSAMAMVQDRPWFGFGLGTWTTAYLKYARYDALANVAAAHNDWLQWAGEGGSPLLILMLVIAGRALWLGWTARWGIGVFCAFIHCLIDFPLQRPAIFYGWRLFFRRSKLIAASLCYSQQKDELLRRARCLALGNHCADTTGI